MFLQIIDFVIWSLFHRSGGTSHRPSHVLCYGYQKSPLRALQGHGDRTTSGIPGVVSVHTNESVRKLKCKPWTEILGLLGSSGDVVLRNMFLDCAIFVRIDQGKDNLHQICGAPISELSKDRNPFDHPSRTTKKPTARRPKFGSCERRKPGTISFVRSRMLYARPSLNAHGNVRFGMKHIHVLNRHRDLTSSKQTVHIMKHIFPMQFGLHNVFTSIVDKTETAQEFKDYTLREHEIIHAEHQCLQKLGAIAHAKFTEIPKRLRGNALRMVEKIRKGHSRCSYTQLLRHYCPVRYEDFSCPNFPSASNSRLSSGQIKTQLSSSHCTSQLFRAQQEDPSRARAGGSILAYATPTAQVSTFCRAAITKVLPGDAVGVGPDGEHNLTMLHIHIDRFVRMRRYESLSLHEVFQKLRVNCIPWLSPPSISQKAKVSQSDRAKRIELFLELLYYVFDSMLVPLIRSNFYVTESNVHRNHLFYFRHDVWRTVSEPSLTDLRLTMFQGLSARDMRQGRHSRLLGHSQVRLLPKESGARPIINLRRKLMKNQNGKRVVSQNVNSRLMPCFATLNYERSLQPQKLGSALFSIGEAHKRLRDFQSVVSVSMKRLYFVKMDVKSCFDTIPQEAIVQMVQGLLSEDRYHISKHAELKPANGRWSLGRLEKPLARFPHSARPTSTPPGLSASMLSELAQKKHRTVFVDLWDARTWESESVLKLLQEHVQRNVVTIDKRFFKQIRGIPQGSILSSLLCNFFYGAFENSCLGFLQPGESLLLRLIDDFLLITTNRDHAGRFARVMVEGNRTYGITVNPAKSLANFEVSIDGVKLPRVHGSQMFPYCGMAINVNSLEISKLRENKDPKVSNGLTVELGRRQGSRFRHKVLDSVKIQMTAMLTDTNLSSRYCVSSNLYQIFMEAGMKMYRYLRTLPKNKRPNESMVIETWKHLVDLAVRMTRGKRSTKTIDEYECAVSKTQVHWLAAAAFIHVMQKKQTGYTRVLFWVKETMDRCQAGMKMDRRQLKELRDEGDRAFQRYEY